MQISEETLTAGKNVVYEILDGGKVKDHSVQLGNEGYGDACVRDRLYVVSDAASEDLAGRIFPLNISDQRRC